MTVPDVKAVVKIAVRYAMTVTPTNIHTTPKTRANQNLGALSPYLKTALTRAKVLYLISKDSNNQGHGPTRTKVLYLNTLRH